MVDVSHTLLDLETVTPNQKKTNRKQKSTTKQESIPVGCILNAHPPWMGWRYDPGVPPYGEQTHGCKNITFPQLRLQAVKRRKEKDEYNIKNINEISYSSKCSSKRSYVPLAKTVTFALHVNEA